ncbi:hypothetical protein LG047_15400 [Methylocystis sp. WRRC1]|uniref:DUF6651 domain-containing protein n=1 Tax=Methylocystis sp. WRRC1 TaxID=1732014 RepID=UPI001D13FB5C|nr:DUF6651 domain-containing protein [Methylocystis sp. WRRC1]MCC3246686.1 hypothetical protein [Methylocystis sp. WRRC1]
MKLKIDENGHVVVADGKPVYVHDDGKEIPFDAPAAVAKIGQLNGEAKGHREAKEEAFEKLKAFEGIEDAAAARKALEIVANLDAKKLVDAGEMERVTERVKSEAVKAYEEKLAALDKKYAPIVKERDQLHQRLVQEKIGGAFSRSKLIADKLAIPPDMVEARFGSAFKLEGDQIVAYDARGEKIFSRIEPGAVAGFDEALEILVDAYPYRDNILKGSGAHGGGASGGASGGAGKQMSRAQFATLSPEAQMAHIRGGGTLSDG